MPTSDARSLRGLSVGSGVRPLSDCVESALQRLEERFARIDPPGATSGMGDVDDLLGRLRPGSITFVVSRAGVGQTTLALQFARATAAAVGPVLIASNDLDSDSVAERLLLMESGIDGERFRDGRMSASDWRTMQSATTRLNRTAVAVADGVTTIRQLEQFLVGARESGESPCLVAVDRADELSGHADRTQRATIAELRHLAQQHHVALLATARPYTDALGYPVTDRLCSSEAAMNPHEDADAVVVLDAQPNSAIVTLRVVRNRYGPLGDIELHLRERAPVFHSFVAASFERWVTP